MGKNQGPDPNKPAQSKTVHGGCHCGAVQFTARIPADSTVLHCNCSICSMTGFVHLIARHEDFELRNDPSALTSYRFNTGQANHLFCSQCGVKSFYQPRSHPDCWSINANCVDNYQPEQWQHQDFDGRNWEQAKNQLDQQQTNT